MRNTVQPGRPNAGNGAHAPNRAQNPVVPYELSGTVRWAESDGTRFVLHVTDTNGHAGGFLGLDVTIDTTESRLAADVLPGVGARVKTRLPRKLEGGLPDLVEAHSVTLT